MNFRNITVISLILFAIAVFGFLNNPLTAETISKKDLDQTYEGINPGDVDIDEGKSHFKKKGPSGKSCNTCHAGGKLKGAATKYPKFVGSAKRVISLQDMISICVVSGTGAKKEKLKSGKIVSLTVYVKNLSNGMPVDVEISNKQEAKALALGELTWKTRRGVRNLSCQVCHETLAGKHLRMQLLKTITGDLAHWPGYRTKKGKVFTVQGRFQQCMKNARMKKMKQGVPAMNGLELYLTKRANGTSIAVPGMVR